MIACPSCARPNPADFAFCPGCGAKLLAEPRRSATQGPLAEERKVVTTLFCDLVGFTATRRPHDPEDVDALLQQLLRPARARDRVHGGVVEKFIGDAVVGVFGVPVVPTRTTQSAPCAPALQHPRGARWAGPA